MSGKHHPDPRCTGLSNLPVMASIPELEEAQERLSQVNCPNCLDLLADDATRDRAYVYNVIVEAEARQHYFRRVAHYVEARSQAVKYASTTNWKDDQWGGNLDD